jgi:hypothetical protein
MTHDLIQRIIWTEAGFFLGFGLMMILCGAYIISVPFREADVIKKKDWVRWHGKAGFIGAFAELFYEIAGEAGARGFFILFGLGVCALGAYFLRLMAGSLSRPMAMECCLSYSLFRSLFH